MNKILIFTNESSWRCISDGIRDRVEWNPYPNENYPVMECTPGVYLVYDSIDDTGLKHLFEDCSNDYYYILIHTRGRQQEDFILWQDRCFIMRGKHDNNVKYYYNPVFDIITDVEGNKIERIVNTIFMPFEQAFSDLLHECLVPHKKLDDSNAYSILSQKEEIRGVLEEFKEKYEASENFCEYKEDWERMRNVIAGYIGIHNHN